MKRVVVVNTRPRRCHTRSKYCKYCDQLTRQIDTAYPTTSFHNYSWLKLSPEATPPFFMAASPL